jgi:hypothetical protein
MNDKIEAQTQALEDQLKKLEEAKTDEVLRVAGRTGADVGETLRKVVKYD